MSPRNETIKARLREIDPLDPGALDATGWERRSEQLLGEILASDPQCAAKEAALPDRRPRLGTQGRLVALAGAAATALALMVVGLPGGGEHKPPVLPALARLAEAAAEQPGPDADLPYLYVKTRDMGISTSVANGRNWSVSGSTVSEKWIAKDGSGRLRRTEAAPVWASPADREAWEAAGGASQFPIETSANAEEAVLQGGCRARLFLRGLFSTSELAEIPTDPEELAAWLEDRVTDPHGGAGAGNGFSIAVRTLALSSELLTNPLASSELRAALYEAEGLIPGIKYLGETRDAIGRPGVAVGAESANSGAPSRYSLIFDPKTSKVLASETTTLKPPAAMPNLRTPVVSEAQLFLEAGNVNSLTELPNGRHEPLGTAQRMDMPKGIICPRQTPPP
jgi:hypothetical protein